MSRLPQRELGTLVAATVCGAPLKDLLKFFGFTADAVVAEARQTIAEASR